MGVFKYEFRIQRTRRRNQIAVYGFGIDLNRPTWLRLSIIITGSSFTSKVKGMLGVVKVRVKKAHRE